MKIMMQSHSNVPKTGPAYARDAYARKRYTIRAPVLVLVAVGMFAIPAGAAEPTVDHADGATQVMSISAVLQGTLTSTGGLPTEVTVYWGATDAEVEALNWDYSADLGTNAVGPLALLVENLWPDRTYYYRFSATNEDGEAWANATTNFHTLLAAGPEPVNLGSTHNFTILAGAAITTTGGGMINGDIGAYPIAGSGIGIPPEQVEGTIYARDASGTQAPNVVIDPDLLLAAKGDLTIAYNDAAGRTPVPTGDFLNPQGGNLGGLTLRAGLYKITTTAYITGADLTLTGGPNDVWIFQCGQDLQVGSGIKVILSGGAQARNIFWQVTTEAVLETFSDFKGTIIADQSVVMKTSSTMEGRALAFTAGVTYNGSGGTLPLIPPPPVFTQIVKTAPNATTVVLTTTPHHYLTLQSSPVLPAVSWSTLGEDFAGESGISTFIDTEVLPVGTSKRFYRAYLSY